MIVLHKIDCCSVVFSQTTGKFSVHHTIKPNHVSIAYHDELLPAVRGCFGILDYKPSQVVDRHPTDIDTVIVKLSFAGTSFKPIYVGLNGGSVC